MAAFKLRDRFIIISGLMVTQTIGWGSTFSQIGILAQPISSDIGISRSIVFSGATVMYLSASLSAPLAGRLADSFGGFRLLGPGSLAIAIGMLILSLSSGIFSYLSAWLIIGLVLHIGLVTAAYTALSQAMGADAPRGIGTLSLATGLCSSIFWPLSEFALHYMDWRMLCQIYAIAIAIICFPIHLWLFKRYGYLRAGSIDSDVPEAHAHIQPGKERYGFALQTAITSCGALFTVGFGIAVIEIFQQLGTPRTDAVFAGSLIGIAFVMSRGLATLWAYHFTPVQMAKLVYIALPLSMAPLLVCHSLGLLLPSWLAVVVALSFGLPAGLVGILSSIFPLYLFGSATYGNVFGQQGRFTGLASALSPAGLSWLISLSISGAIGALMFVGGLAFLGTLKIEKMTRENSS